MYYYVVSKSVGDIILEVVTSLFHLSAGNRMLRFLSFRMLLIHGVRCIEAF